MEDFGANNNLSDADGHMHVQAGRINGQRPDGRKPGSRAHFTVHADGDVTDYLPHVPEYEVAMVDSEDQLPEGAIELPNGEYCVVGQGIWAVRSAQETTSEQSASQAEGDRIVLPKGSMRLPDQRYYIPEKGVFDERDLPEALGITATGHVLFDIVDENDDEPAPGAKGSTAHSTHDYRVIARTTYLGEDGEIIADHSVNGYVSGEVHQLPPDFEGGIHMKRPKRP